MPWKFYTQPCASCWNNATIVSISTTAIKQVENAIYGQWYETIVLSNWKVRYRYNWWLYPYPPVIDETDKTESEEGKTEETQEENILNGLQSAS